MNEIHPLFLEVFENFGITQKKENISSIIADEIVEFLEKKNISLEEIDISIDNNDTLIEGTAYFRVERHKGSYDTPGLIDRTVTDIVIGFGQKGDYILPGWQLVEVERLAKRRML